MKTILVSNVKPDLRRIIVVGGNGQLGRLFVQMFRLSGYQVDVLENRLGNEQIVYCQMPAILVAVPIDILPDH